MLLNNAASCSRAAGVAPLGHNSSRLAATSRCAASSRAWPACHGPCSVQRSRHATRQHPRHTLVPVPWGDAACSSQPHSAKRARAAAAASTSEAAGVGPSTLNSSSSSSSGTSSPLDANPSLLRKVLSTSTAAEALDLLMHQQPGQQQQALSAEDAELLLERSLEAGNAKLALSMYEQLCLAKRAAAGAGSSSIAAPSLWPPATLQHTETLIQGLCRQLRVAECLGVLSSIRSQGMPGPDAEVSFGHVVSSPLPPQQPLAVVQPQEGGRVVSDSNSRYEFELFSGTVTSCSSEALQPGGNPLLSAARALGLWRRQPVAAVHELVVTAPGGGSRTFRVGTASADVPAQRGERITVVCAPSAGANTRKRLVLTTSPPGTQPGQAMLISNHATGAELPLLRPPLPGAQTTLPGWLLPAAVLLAGGDAVSGLVDPALPLLIGGTVALAAGSAVVSSTLLLPSLKKLPAESVKLESIRQQLLAQHASLNAKVKATMQEASEDVRTLARLWQLQAKMQTVDGGAGSSYEARIARVAAVAGGIEGRLSKRLELLDGYARVMNMIEIEVEMEMQIPIAELDGIGVELEKLSELESIREEWQYQAEAQDEVERLLRTAPTSLPAP